MVLPYLDAKQLPGLWLSLLGVKIERNRRPRWLSNYSFNPINAKILPIYDLSTMQYGRCLDRLLQEIVYADPKLGPVHIVKADVSEGFYRVGLGPTDAAKLGLVFPNEAGEEDLLAIPLTLPMGWKHSPPIFCIATETVEDLANEALRAYVPTQPHKLDERDEAVWLSPPKA